MKNLTYILIILTGLVSCDCSTQKQHTNPEGSSNGGIGTMEQRMNAQKNFLEKERESIEAYIADRQLVMERTGTGLYYEILEDSTATDIVETEDIVEYEYDIYLMNGYLLYSSEETGNRILRVDKEDAEIGIHESLKLLGLGDKGRFILPSHLAFGVAGDQEKVPPLTPLVYELKVVNIKKSKS